MYFFFAHTGDFNPIKSKKKWVARKSRLPELQVNLCQKHFFLQNMGRRCYVQKLFWMSETISVHNMFSPGLSLEFNEQSVVILWVSWCKNKSFWQRFTCTEDGDASAIAIVAQDSPKGFFKNIQKVLRIVEAI